MLLWTLSTVQLYTLDFTIAQIHLQLQHIFQFLSPFYTSGIIK